MLDLYAVFRQMRRLWRWMKKLKWAGYSCHAKSVTDIGARELATFCIACPQTDEEHKNVEENWEDDPNSWVYKRILVADGNFKADHVKAKTLSQDVWLSEGGGMDPKRAVYWAFLKDALERFTVSSFILLRVRRKEWRSSSF